MKGEFMKSKQNIKKQKIEDQFELNDFDIKSPEVIREPMQIVPKYEGKLKMLKTSVSLTRYVVDDLRRLARIKGMSSYQSLLRELLAEKIYEEKRRLNLFEQNRL